MTKGSTDKEYFVVLSNDNFHRRNQRGLPVVRVLFVCTGNICRSPIAEGVFRTFVARAGLLHRFVIDSAGTHDYQVGEPPDPRALAAARRRGYLVPKRRARKLAVDDFARFDWILAMDRHNLRELQTLRPLTYSGHLGLLLELAQGTGSSEVPDPYYGSLKEFEQVLDLLEHGAGALLTAIQQEFETKNIS